MLSYAYRSLRWEGFLDVADEDFEKVEDLYAEILARGMEYQIKRGIHREYVERSENASVIRGRIDVADTIKTQSIWRRRLTCYCDEFAEDSRLNQVVKAAMQILYRGTMNREQKKRLRNILYILHEVKDVDWRTINWHFRFDRNNELYRMLVGISYLVVQGKLLSMGGGSRQMQKIVDEQNEWDLYEHFILEFYRYHHRELNARPALVEWNTENKVFLPTMKTDITLIGPERALIIDAKYPYKGGILHSNTKYEDAGLKLSSGNMYQIYTYVKNKDKEHSGKVSGMLLYARTNEETIPDEEYEIDGNTFYVRTLDLSSRFEEIAENLHKIARLVA